jgi:hypothetical protein
MGDMADSYTCLITITQGQGRIKSKKFGGKKRQAGGCFFRASVAHRRAKKPWKNRGSAGAGRADKKGMAEPGHPL